MFYMTPEEHDLARNCNKIAAIKAIVARANVGLKEAKDGYEENYPSPIPEVVKSPSHYTTEFYPGAYSISKYPQLEIHIEGYDGGTFDTTVPAHGGNLPQVVAFLVKVANQIPKDIRHLSIRKVSKVLC
jgi:hypothetical protein